MSSVTPTGPFSEPESRLRNLLAASTTFQGMVNRSAPTAAKAKDAIYFAGFIGDDDQVQGRRPFAIVSSPDNGSTRFERIAGGGGGSGRYRKTGPLSLDIEADLAGQYADDLPDADLAFKNLLGAIVLEMLDLSGTDDGAGGMHLYISTLSIAEGPYRNNYDTEATRGQYYTVRLAVEWDG